MGFEQEVIVALVEEKARLLALEEIDLEFQAVDRDDLLRFPPRRQHAVERGQALLFAGRGQRFFDQHRARVELADDGEDVFLEIFHAGGRDLDDEIVVEAVDDQAGQEIGLAVDHAVIGILRAQPQALAVGLRDAPAQEIAVDHGFRLVAQHAEGDGRGGVDVAGGDVHVRGRIEPAQFPGLEALQAAADLVVVGPEFAVEDALFLVRLQDQLFVFDRHAAIICDFPIPAKRRRSDRS